MKILSINAAYHHGGASIHAMDTCKGLTRLGHNVVYLTMGEKKRNYQKDGYQVEILVQKTKLSMYHYFNPYILYKLKNLLIKHRPDVLHLHNINLQSFSLASLFYSKFYPIVWTLHDVWPICMVGWPGPNICEKFRNKCPDCPNWPQPVVNMNRFMKESVYQLNDFAITCPSQWMRRNLQKSKLYNKTIEVVPLAIDPETFNNIEIKNELSLPDKYILLFVGGKRISGSLPAWRKGWEVLCEALKLLNDIKNQIHLLYVGDEVKMPEGVNVTATFVRNIHRNEMFSFYKAVNLFVLPSMADNSPLTIIEAMYCRVPIIASNVGGIPELIDHGKTGLLCPPTDSIALANSIKYMINKPRESKRMAKAGFEKSKRYHGYESMIRRYEKLFNKIKKGKVREV